MKSEIHLLYFEGCPNVNKARGNLRAALKASGLSLAWTETNLEDPKTSQNWRGFPSPTILINDAEIFTGAMQAAGTRSCRFGGAPSIEAIAARLHNGKIKGLGSLLGVLPATLVGLFPGLFCPACYPALAGLLGSIGLGALVGEALLKPLMILFLAVALLGLAHQARKNRRFGPLALGLGGAIGIYAGFYPLSSAAVKATGISLLVAASIWNVFPKLGLNKKQSRPQCKTREVT